MIPPPARQHDLNAAIIDSRTGTNAAQADSFAPCHISAFRISAPEVSTHTAIAVHGSPHRFYSAPNPERVQPTVMLVGN